ncbi:PLP-dependent aminotransferase family protein [Arvimicrobium flavum]|uniref:aminotransferase-like domain-containing protein n=1 Tax=Arvimicrobium flavum TaxID=3393320 RepID=UPI00237AF33C|nr:PLP-dependent aminotransferase family protein [Mesorhizobium shangrilense]
MTNWLPDLSSGSGPLYLRLADKAEADIASGALPAGRKLPPQRDLAYDIGVTIGTVGRAYSLLRERGLVNGEVGRGTYVLEREADKSPAVAPVLAHSGDSTRHLDAPAGKLRFDSTAAPDIGQSAAIAELLSTIMREHPGEMASYTRTFPDHWSEAGANWLSRNGFRPDPGGIVPTLGVHAAVMSVIAALTVPGDYIVYEHVTYAQLARSAGLIGRRAAMVEVDAQGLDPEDFERVCAQKHPRMAFVMPTAQNPTVASMPGERRAELVRIARAYNVLLIEDDLYGAMAEDATPLLTELAPERTFLVGGLSKAVSAGVRGGWVACPQHYRHRVRVAHKMLTGGMPFLLAELGARLVLSGAARDIRTRALDEVNARLAIVRTALDGYDYRMEPNIPFIWIALPEPWLSGTFKQAAYEAGVLIDDEDEFKAGRSDKSFHRVRIGISAPKSREDVTRGLATLRRLLDEGRAGYDSFG